MLKPDDWHSGKLRQCIGVCLCLSGTIALSAKNGFVQGLWSCHSGGCQLAGMCCQACGNPCRVSVTVEGCSCPVQTSEWRRSFVVAAAAAVAVRGSARELCIWLLGEHVAHRSGMVCVVSSACPILQGTMVVHYLLQPRGCGNVLC